MSAMASQRESQPKKASFVRWAIASFLQSQEWIDYEIERVTTQRLDLEERETQLEVSKQVVEKLDRELNGREENVDRLRLQLEVVRETTKKEFQREVKRVMEKYGLTWFQAEELGLGKMWAGTIEQMARDISPVVGEFSSSYSTRRGKTLATGDQEFQRKVEIEHYHSGIKEDVIGELKRESKRLKKETRRIEREETFACREFGRLEKKYNDIAKGEAHLEALWMAMPMSFDRLKGLERYLEDHRRKGLAT